MIELFKQFLESPDRESYLAIRAAVISSKYYAPYSDELDQVEELISMGQLEEASQKLSISMPNLILSPRAHLMRCSIAEQLNNEQEVNIESFIATTCCQGILATGDGSEDNPYIVVAITDEYDILGYLGKQIKKQELHQNEKQYFDRFECKDDTEVWFDITSAYNKVWG